MKNISAFAKLANDTYTGDIVKFQHEDGRAMTVADGQASINQAILDAVGGTWSYRAFQSNKNAVFANRLKISHQSLPAKVVDTVCNTSKHPIINPAATIAGTIGMKILPSNCIIFSKIFSGNLFLT